MTVRIITADVLDGLAQLEDESADLIVADPPYGETSLAWDRAVKGWPAAAARVLKPTGSLWIFGTLRRFMEVADDLTDWRLAQDLIWEKHNGSNAFADRSRRVHEQVAQFYRADARWSAIYKTPLYTNDARARVVRRKKRPPQWGEINGTTYRSEDGGPRLMRSVMFCRSCHGSAVHPTQKPVEIIEPLIAYSCPPSGLVVDPFCGSGSSGIAAKRIGCDFIGIDKDAGYCALAERRIAADAPLFSASQAEMGA